MLWAELLWVYHGVPGIGLVAIGRAFWAAFSSSVISTSLGSLVRTHWCNIKSEKIQSEFIYIAYLKEL